MKLSVSLSEADVAALDKYVAENDLPSRSAALQRAIRLLRYENLEQDYAEAYAEWEESGEQELWDSIVGEGLDHAQG